MKIISTFTLSLIIIILLIISVKMRGHMKHKTLGIPNLPQKNKWFPYWDLHNPSINFCPPAQRGSQTILTISEYGCCASHDEVVRIRWSPSGSHDQVVSPCPWKWSYPGTSSFSRMWCLTCDLNQSCSSCVSSSIPFHHHVSCLLAYPASIPSPWLDSHGWCHVTQRSYL